MIKRFYHYGFLLPAAAFIVHQILQHGFQVHFPFVDAYLNPFCAGSLALYAISIERQYLFGEPRLSLMDVLITVAFVGIITELAFPIFSANFISDWGRFRSHLLRGMLVPYHGRSSLFRTRLLLLISSSPIISSVVRLQSQLPKASC